ncbi:MAG: AsmA family protein [Pseudomonadales bacterium]|nr:AsmA family protein [Pseudomonadales bacterium]
MKRLITPGIALLVIIALAVSANRILQRTLDAELPKLLSSQLGIAVTLEPTRTRISTLTVRTPRLVMGDPDNPALVATRVMVSLNWSDLLRGEIRLRRAAGATLMVNSSLWPGNDDPWPTDYRFLDPYLPDHITLESALYVFDDKHSYAFKRPQWRRKPPGMTLQFGYELDGQPVELAARLDSLDDLLRLARVQMHIDTQATDREESQVKADVDLQPGETSGYKLAITVAGAGMTAAIQTGNSSAWELPDTSSSHIPQLDIKKLLALADDYSAESTAADAEAFLTSTLPRLSLPEHSGRLTSDEIHWKNEVVLDATVDFASDDNGLKIPAFSARGEGGLLHGELDITSSETGWQLQGSAAISAATPGKSLAAKYMESSWLWREGNAKLHGRGQTWGALLDSMQGDIAIKGSHRGAKDTPVSVTAVLDSRPGEFAMDKIDIRIGDGYITGAAKLSGDKQRRLSGTISAHHVDLDFLAPEPDPQAQPGTELPTYLEILPGIDLDWQLELSQITFRDFIVTGTRASFLRNPEKLAVNALVTAQDDARLELQLLAGIAPGKATDVSLRADLTRFSFAHLFRQGAPLPQSRTSGSIVFDSKGNTLRQIFEAMKGTADLSIDHRPDDNWTRPAIPEDVLQVAGAARLVLNEDRITGLEISDLAIDSISQNLTGTASIADGRKPWLIANLESDKLDLARLSTFGEEDGTADTSSSSLDSLKQLWESQISLNASSMIVAGETLDKVRVELATAPNSVKIARLDFSQDKGSLSSHGEIRWLNDTATLSLEARVTDFKVREFLTDVPSANVAPLSGTVSLHSTGDSVASLLASLNGDIKLASTNASAESGTTPGEIDMVARRTDYGMEADIRRFRWEGTDLAGKIRYHDTTPPLVEADINGGSLSLLPWEADKSAAADPSDKDSGESMVAKTAKASIDMVGNVLMAPLRLVSGPREAEPGEKLFTSTPLPKEWLGRYQARIKGRLDSVKSREATVSDLELSGSLLDGELTVEASAGKLNGGSASMKMNITAPDVIALTVSGTFINLTGDNSKSNFARSGYFDVTSRGDSQAELAGNLNGIVYLELGAGNLDYSKMMLLTADVATTAFQTLIPGIEKKPPELKCGVTLGIFKDGIGKTPYGYAARTHQANLVGQVEINLKKETIHLNFSSSSRKGMGISIGNVFSNTVEIEGPLTDPKIIPNATGILWRGWAAVMTGGLSVFGESMLKRALASENPCLTVQKHIHKEFCTTDNPATSSPLVCPPA